MTDSKPRIGYLGIGLWVKPMTIRLLDAGYSLTVWNRSPAKLDKVVARGAVAAKNAEGTRRTM